VRGQLLAPHAVASPPRQPKPYYSGPLPTPTTPGAQSTHPTTVDVEHAATSAGPLDHAVVVAYDGYLNCPRIVRRQAGSDNTGVPSGAALKVVTG
jgi:hypothetical protein